MMKDLVVWTAILLGCMAFGWALCVSGLWILGVL